MQNITQRYVAEKQINVANVPKGFGEMDVLVSGDGLEVNENEDKSS